MRNLALAKATCLVIVMAASSCASRRVIDSGSGYALTILQTITDEREFARFRADLERATVLPGHVRIGNDGKEELVVEGEVIQAGYEIEVTPRAENGWFAISFYERKPRHEDENDNIANGITSSVWLVRNKQTRVLASRSGTHARFPCLSPDGRKLAFRGIGISSSPRFPSLLVMDTASTEVTRLLVCKAMGTIVGPLKWTDGNKSLWVSRSDRENAGDFRLELISVAHLVARPIVSGLKTQDKGKDDTAGGQKSGD